MYLFSRNVHDSSLPLSVQTTCVRLMLNLVIADTNHAYIVTFINMHFRIMTCEVSFLVANLSHLV